MHIELAQLLVRVPDAVIAGLRARGGGRDARVAGLRARGVGRGGARALSSAVEMLPARS